MPEKEDLIKSFKKNLKNKKFDKAWELDFWLNLIPSLDVKALKAMNQNLIDEQISKLKLGG